MPEIKSRRVRLVAAADAAAIAAIYAPIVAATAISFEEVPPDTAEMQRRIAASAADFPWLVAEIDAELIGFAYASPHRVRSAYRWSVDVSVYVSERARRRGVARLLYSRLLCILSEQGFYTAFAGVALPNDASVALHHHLGFVDVGTYRDVGYKMGAWRSVLWLARTLRSTASAPQELRPMSAFAPHEIASLFAVD